MEKRLLPTEGDIATLRAIRGLEVELALGGEAVFRPGDTRAGTPLTAEQISKGIEDIRTGRYRTPEGDSLITLAREWKGIREPRSKVHRLVLDGNPGLLELHLKEHREHLEEDERERRELSPGPFVLMGPPSPALKALREQARSRERERKA